MRERCWVALAGWMAIVVAGCGQGRRELDAEAEAPAVNDEDTEASGNEMALFRGAKDLGPGERRFNVFVLPGDAAVEVNGVPVRRRDGVVELTGKVGDERRLRLTKGVQYHEEVVKLDEAGASPALLDLDARAAPPLGSGGGARTAGSVLPPYTRPE